MFTDRKNDVHANATKNVTSLAEVIKKIKITQFIWFLKQIYFNNNSVTSVVTNKAYFILEGKTLTFVEKKKKKEILHVFNDKMYFCINTFTSE